jgi:hypothetical protein
MLDRGGGGPDDVLMCLLGGGQPSLLMREVASPSGLYMTLNHLLPSYAWVAEQQQQQQQQPDDEHKQVLLAADDLGEIARHHLGVVAAAYGVLGGPSTPDSRLLEPFPGAIAEVDEFLRRAADAIAGGAAAAEAVRAAAGATPPDQRAGAFAPSDIFHFADGREAAGWAVGRKLFFSSRVAIQSGVAASTIFSVPVVYAAAAAAANNNDDEGASE